MMDTGLENQDIWLERFGLEGTFRDHLFQPLCILRIWLGNCINFVDLISLLHKISSVSDKFIAELVQIF